MSLCSVKIHIDLFFFPSNIKIYGTCTKRLKVSWKQGNALKIPIPVSLPNFDLDFKLMIA